MTPRNIIRFGGATLSGIGTILLVATGSIASALRALGGGLPGALLMTALACSAGTFHSPEAQPA